LKQVILMVEAIGTVACFNDRGDLRQTGDSQRRRSVRGEKGEKGKTGKQAMEESA